MKQARLFQPSAPNGFHISVPATRLEPTRRAPSVLVPGPVPTEWVRVRVLKN